MSFLGAALAAMAMTGAPAAPGVWSGDRLVMTIMATGVRLQGDCADGLIGAPIVPDAKGRFIAHGSFAEQTGGPQLLGDESAAPPTAIFSGVIDGDELRLAIKSDDGSPERHFTLKRGTGPKLHRCA